MELLPKRNSEYSGVLQSTIFVDAYDERLSTEQLQDKELNALLVAEVSSFCLRQIDGIYMNMHVNVTMCAHPGKRASSETRHEPCATGHEKRSKKLDHLFEFRFVMNNSTWR